MDTGSTLYPKKYAHGFCFAVLCCGYTLTDFPIYIRLTSLALWQSDDCPSASKATLMNMDKYFIWIHYERLHNHNKAKHNKTVCIFLGIHCISIRTLRRLETTRWCAENLLYVWIMRRGSAVLLSNRLTNCRAIGQFWESSHSFWDITRSCDKMPYSLVYRGHAGMK